jgi:hypothetical protein
MEEIPGMAWPLKFARRVRAVEGRSSAGARLVLQQYVNNEQYFEELIGLLEHLPGRIFQEDVINTLAYIKLSSRKVVENNTAR